MVPFPVQEQFMSDSGYFEYVILTAYTRVIIHRSHTFETVFTTYLPVLKFETTAKFRFGSETFINLFEIVQRLTWRDYRGGS